jgi:hypothetical protein
MASCWTCIAYKTARLQELKKERDDLQQEELERELKNGGK